MLNHTITRTTYPVLHIRLKKNHFWEGKAAATVAIVYMDLKLKLKLTTILIQGEGKIWIYFLGDQSVLLECSNREQVLNDDV